MIENQKFKQKHPKPNDLLVLQVFYRNIDGVNGLICVPCDRFTRNMIEHIKSIYLMFGPNEHRRITQNPCLFCNTNVDEENKTKS